MITCDTNIFLHAANGASPCHVKATKFLEAHHNDTEFVLCELILFELYMQLRNPTIFKKPLSAKASYNYCQAYRNNSAWRVVDYHAQVTVQLWQWAASSRRGFRNLIDARIALTLLHHGVTEFATANTKDFKEFKFERVWNPFAINCE